MSQGRRLWLGILAAGFLAGGGLWAWRQRWPLYRRLQAEGAGTRGFVTAKGLAARDSVHYSFHVGAKLYSGVDEAGFGTPSFEELAVDDDVLVFYLPGDPDVSILGDPKEHLRSQNCVLALVLMAAAPVIWLALRREFQAQ